MAMKRVVLKLSGELFKPSSTDGKQECLDVPLIDAIITDIKTVQKTHLVNIVIGGGNFFRGLKEGKALGLRPVTADTIGMLATVMNGIMLRELFVNRGVPCVLLNAYAIPGVVHAVDPIAIEKAQEAGEVIIFSGGTGNPFCSTDTAAVLRALQVGADTVWKATKVDYVYQEDPMINPQALPLKQLTYAQALAQNLAVMDSTAIALAQEHDITLRVFSLFKPQALLHISRDPDFGSTIIK